MARPLQQQIIARALDLISDETRWTCLVIARKADGKTCEWSHPLASRFCAVGALDRAAYELLGTGGTETALRAEKFVLAANDRPNDSLFRINDQEGHAVIVAMFERALAS